MFEENIQLCQLKTDIIKVQESESFLQVLGLWVIITPSVH